MKLHIHSDCSFFAGCENMLAVLFSDDSLRNSYDVTFSYRQSSRYEDGLRSRIKNIPPSWPLRLPDIDDALAVFPGITRKFFSVLARLTFCHQFAALWSGSVLWKIFGNIRPDIVHINNGGWPGAASSRAAILAAHARGAKVVCMVNNIAVSYRFPRRWPDWPIDRLAVQYVDRWVVANSAAKQALIDVLNLTPDAVTVIANGIPPRIADESREAARQRLQIPTDRVAFASVALFEPRKGHRFILEALHQISLRLAAEKIPLMLIEGNGPGREALEKYALELNISPYVRFIGSERNMANLLAASDGFIESSIAASPSPNVVSEAMAVGLPVIASVHSSMDQIEDGQDGILVDPKDTAALSQAVQRLSGSPALRHSLGHAAKATFTHKFSASQASQRYLDLYKEVTI